MNKVDLRQSKMMYVFLLLVSILFCLGFVVFPLKSTQDYLLATLVILFFGVGGIGLSIFSLFIAKGRSGVVFYTDHFLVELANGTKKEFRYTDLQALGVQEMTLPLYAQKIIGAAQVGTAVVSPASLIVSPELFQQNNMALGLLFNPTVDVPETGKMDTYIYSKSKLDTWSDENKMSLYVSFLNISPKKRKELYDFLINGAHLNMQVIPALKLK